MEEQRNTGKIKHILYYVGRNIETEDGKVNLSFWEPKPYGYNGIKVYNFTMTKEYLQRLLDYRNTVLELKQMYVVYTKYNYNTHTTYISSMAAYEPEK